MTNYCLRKLRAFLTSRQHEVLQCFQDRPKQTFTPLMLNFEAVDIVDLEALVDAKMITPREGRFQLIIKKRGKK